MTLDFKIFVADLWRRVTNGKNHQMKQRLNISLTGEQEVYELEDLRLLLEKRLGVRLSMAEVIRHMTKIVRAQELALNAWPKAANS